MLSPFSEIDLSQRKNYRGEAVQIYGFFAEKVFIDPSLYSFSQVDKYPFFLGIPG